MHWLKRHLTEIFCVLFLSVIVGVVAVQNYTPGTFLTGIDNFHIEFDLGLALSRAWSGVWQENQGVGIVSGLAQMTELPRVAIYQALSWVMPRDLIRYAYVFGNLYLGVIGVFFLIWYLSKSRLAGLGGALFYLFNLGTLQVFFMPTEMFVVNFTALSWLFLLVFKYFREGKRVSLWWYAGLLLLFAPMAMTPTIFVVHLMFLGIICVGYLLSREKFRVKWRRVVGIIGVTLGMSMYFLLPFANFALNNAVVLKESKINSVFSQENYLMNASRTSWGDLATLKGMWFDYPDNIDGKLVPLLGVWDQYLSRLGMWIYLPMIVMGMGIVAMLWKKKWWGIVVVMGAVSIVLLRGENPPVGELVGWLRSLPLVAEAFRTPYTKIAPILTLVYSVFFGYGIYALGQIWRFRIGKILWKALMMGGVVAGLIWLNLPYFQGKLISEGVRVKIPNEYFEMFNFFKTQDKFGRVVRLPAYSSQAWDYANWGYRGSGFLWYGIEQPILDRAFDVWSPYNETFYNEFSNVLYSCSGIPVIQCSSGVAKVLEKYDVRYVLLDESVIAPGQGKEILRIEETKKLASELGWTQIFKEGFLSVYEIHVTQVPVGSDLPAVESAGWARPLRSDPGEQGISVPSSYTWVEGDTSKVRKDVIYGDVGTYVTSNSQITNDKFSNGGQGALVYPFARLMREEVKNVEYGVTGVTIGSDLPAVESAGWDQPLRSDPGKRELSLIIPGWKVGDIVRVEYEEGEPLPVYRINGENGPRFLGKERPEEGKNIIYARVSEGEEWSEYLKEQRFDLQGVTLKVEVPGEPQIYDFGKVGQGTVGNCDVLKRGRAEKQILKGSLPVSPEAQLNISADGRDLLSWRDPELQGASYIADERGAACDYIVMGELDTRLSYLMRMQGENKEGRSLKYFLYNTGSKRNDIEWLLTGSHPVSPTARLNISADGRDLVSGRDPREQGAGRRFDQTFSLLPWAWDGTYTLNIETRSFGQRAENVISPVEVRWFPLEQIAGAKIIPSRSDLVGFENDLQPTRSDLRVTEVHKTGTWLYRVKVEGSGLLKLSQGYDEGWISLDLEHVKVDGWANGWMIPQSGTATIFYWPQLLEYLGFAILGGTILILVVKRK